MSLLCCPRGLSFTTDRIYSPSVSPKPQDKDSTTFHTFLVTREDGSRIYGTALTFFEVRREKIDDGTVGRKIWFLTASMLFIGRAGLNRIKLDKNKGSQAPQYQLRYPSYFPFYPLHSPLLLFAFPSSPSSSSFFVITSGRRRKCGSVLSAPRCRLFTRCIWPSWRTRRAKLFTTTSTLLPNERRRRRWADAAEDRAGRTPLQRRRRHPSLISSLETSNQISTTSANCWVGENYRYPPITEGAEIKEEKYPKSLRTSCYTFL